MLPLMPKRGGAGTYLMLLYLVFVQGTAFFTPLLWRVKAYYPLQRAGWSQKQTTCNIQNNPGILNNIFKTHKYIIYMPIIVNRRNAGYHQNALANKNDLDLIASALLAFNYSRRVKQTPKSQSLIQMDCVAVCFINLPNIQNNGLWVASNSQQIFDQDLNELKQFLLSNSIYTDIYTIAEGNRKEMHAEMQLLCKIIQVVGQRDDYIRSLNLSFGVSKPCCSQCSSLLGSYKIDHTMQHLTRVTNWQSPI